jgi:hypothetical protein
MTKHLLLAFLAVGCKSPDKVIDVPPDAMPDADTVAMNAIVVESFGETPLFIMYRDGDRAWQAPTTISGGYEFRVHDAYQLLAVCDGGGYYQTGIEAGTYDESGGMTYLPCYGSTEDTPPTTVQVTGVMAQPGFVSVGGAEATGTTTNWPFTLDVETGVHDLVAVANTKILIRRDVNVAAAMSVAGVDPTVAMTAVPYTIGNDADENVTTQMYLLTENDFTLMPERMGATAYVAPDTLLMANDRQYAVVMANGSQTWRGVFARYTSGSSTTYTLMPRLSGVQFTATGASWSTALPEGDVSMYLAGDSAQVQMQASKGWLGSRTEIALDTTTIPGFNPAWFPSTTQYRGLTVVKNESQLSLATGVTSF